MERKLEAGMARIFTIINGIKEYAVATKMSLKEPSPSNRQVSDQLTVMKEKNKTIIITTLLKISKLTPLLLLKIYPP
jgi:hypothetical protein